MKTPDNPEGCPFLSGNDVVVSLPFSGLHAVADGQPSATFASPAREYLTAVLRRHAGPKSVGVFPFTPMRLIRAFHVDTPVRIVTVCKALQCTKIFHYIQAMLASVEFPYSINADFRAFCSVLSPGSIFCNFFPCSDTLLVLYS